MSEDSDWESDDDAAATTADTAASATDASATTASATTTATASSASPLSTDPVPPVLLALRMRLALKDHPALGGGIDAVASLLHDTKQNRLSMLLYDTHTRPMLLEPLDAGRVAKPSLALSYMLGDGEGNGLTAASLLDSQARKWTITFDTIAEGTRFAMAFGVACMVSKAGAGGPTNQIFVKHDLARGAGKSCKAKSFLSLQLKVWSILIDAGNGISKLSPGTGLMLFNPDLTVGSEAAPAASGAVPFTQPIINTTLSDIEIGDDISSSSVPASLSEALAGGKLKTDGGSRLFFIDATSELGVEILKDKKVPHGSILLIQLNPIAISKKKEKKEKKDKKKEKNDEDDSTSTNGTADASNDASNDSTSSSSSSSANPFTAWSSDLSSTLTPLIPALTAMNDQISGVASMQQKIVKFCMNELYEGLVEDLGLTAVVEAQNAPAAADESAPAPAPVDPAQAAQLAAIQTRVRSLVSGFMEKNSVEHKGTLASVVKEWKANLLPVLQPLVNPSGILGESKLQSLAASGGGGGDSDKLKTQMSKLTSTHAAQLKKLEDANKILQESFDKQKKALSDLDTKHTNLVMKHVDMEDANTKLEISNSELTKKSSMCSVFESGLTDMRNMLDKEIEEKSKIEQAWIHLSQYQKNFKLTWLPEKVVTHCMKCSAKFSLFGASKGHCRYCGRVFCKDCCSQCAIPEFGYGKERVKICKPCLQFRIKVLGEKEQDDKEERAAAQQQQGNDEDDDDDDAGDMGFGGSSSKPAASSNNTRQNNKSNGKDGAPIGRQSGGILSYDSDELEG